MRGTDWVAIFNLVDVFVRRSSPRSLRTSKSFNFCYKEMRFREEEVALDRIHMMTLVACVVHIKGVVEEKSI